MQRENGMRSWARSMRSARMVGLVGVLIFGSGALSASGRAGSTLAPLVIGDVMGQSLDAIGRELGKLHDLRAGTAGSMQASREAFWAQYPNGAGRAEAERRFARNLLAKDLLALQVFLGADENSRSSNLLYMAFVPDGGIPELAWPSFSNWVESVRRTARGRSSSKGQLTIGGLFEAQALSLSSLEYQRYRIMRDWAEFVRAGRVRFKDERELAAARDSESFATFLLYQYLPCAESFPVCYRSALERLGELASQHGTEKVLAAASRVLTSPRAELPRYTAEVRPPAVLAGSLVQNPSRLGCSHPLISRCFVQIVTGSPPPFVNWEELSLSSDPREYALYLVWDKTGVAGPDTPFDVRFAEAQRLVTELEGAVGAARVRAAAEKIMAAPRVRVDRSFGGGPKGLQIEPGILADPGVLGCKEQWDDRCFYELLDRS